ncbi:hypothetical protein ACIRBZ_03930 [Streptomyces sp. NPDC094038]|uniref:hypothetical protein n=1 Tax=Streptomyces sp. NPDC094038 TaxID=3366055 RepID=UPI003824B9B6
MRTARGSAAAALAMAAAVPASTAGAPAPRHYDHHHPSPPTRLYVAPWGDDHGPGTFDRPFATPARAQRAVRAIAPRMTSDVTVNLRGATYRLTSPLRLTTPCTAHPTCATITTIAGPRPPYRGQLGLGSR